MIEKTVSGRGLTNQDIKDAAPREKTYMLFDREGLYLRVFPSGTKVWLLRVYKDKKIIQRRLGNYPEVGLMEARRLRRKCRESLEAAEKKSSVTFGQLAEKWLAEYSATKSENTLYNHKLRLSYVKELMDCPITDLKRAQLVEALQAVHRRKGYDAACRSAVAIGQVYRHAMNCGLIDSTPAERLSSALSPTKDERKVTHFAAILDEDEIGKLLRAMETIPNPIVKNALFFIAYTFPRSGELRNALWSEVNFKKSIWIIPAEHTKCRKELIVPLARQAIELLEAEKNLSPYKPGQIIFSSLDTGGIMSKSTMLFALKTLRTLPDDIRPGEMTVHGFRSMASTLLNRSGKWRPDAIERQLGHSPENEVRAAYNREDYMEERVKMMQWYADYLDELKGSA